jgi:hypothetical protein
MALSRPITEQYSRSTAIKNQTDLILEGGAEWWVKCRHELPHLNIWGCFVSVSFLSDEWSTRHVRTLMQHSLFITDSHRTYNLFHCQISVCRGSFHLREQQCRAQTPRIYVGFEVFTAVVMKSAIFWDMTPCSLLSCNRRFWGRYRLHLQGRRNNFSKNQQVSRSVATQQTTRRHIPEDDTLHVHIVTCTP